MTAGGGARYNPLFPVFPCLDLGIQQSADWRRSRTGGLSGAMGGAVGGPTARLRMVMMVVVSTMRPLGALHILLQAGKGTLSAGKVTGLEGGLESLKIFAHLAGRAGSIARVRRR